MDKNELIRITNNLYNLTRLFPKKEPLRQRVRAEATDILADFSLEEPLEIIKRIESLRALLSVAQEQKWVKSELVLNVIQDYDNLNKELKGIESSSSENQLVLNLSKPTILSAPVISNKENNHNNRQEKILEMLKDRGKIQVWEVKKSMPEISKRTLRRDFEYLLGQKLVERIGDKNQTFYQLPVGNHRSDKEIALVGQE